MQQGFRDFFPFRLCLKSVRKIVSRRFPLTERKVGKWEKMHFLKIKLQLSNAESRTAYDADVGKLPRSQRKPLSVFTHRPEWFFICFPISMSVLLFLEKKTIRRGKIENLFIFCWPQKKKNLHDAQKKGLGKIVCHRYQDGTAIRTNNNSSYFFFWKKGSKEMSKDN